VEGEEDETFTYNNQETSREIDNDSNVNYDANPCNRNLFDSRIIYPEDF
jgi:hypothetical protein